jgi:hypothetical protein
VLGDSDHAQDAVLTGASNHGVHGNSSLEALPKISSMMSLEGQTTLSIVIWKTPHHLVLHDDIRLPSSAHTSPSLVGVRQANIDHTFKKPSVGTDLKSFFDADKSSEHTDDMRPKKRNSRGS